MSQKVFQLDLFRENLEEKVSDLQDFEKSAYKSLRCLFAMYSEMRTYLIAIDKRTEMLEKEVFASKPSS